MYIAIIGLVAGIIIGIFSPLQIPLFFARYTAIGILGILDSMLGAFKGELQDKYDPTIFISGLIFNMAIAIGITYLGDHLNLDLYIAAIVFFTFRIFRNLGTIRYSILEKIIGRRRIKHELEEKGL